MCLPVSHQNERNLHLAAGEAARKQVRLEEMNFVVSLEDYNTILHEGDTAEIYLNEDGTVNKVKIICPHALAPLAAASGRITLATFARRPEPEALEFL